MSSLIGLAGYAQVGKNTVADALGSSWEQVAFADPLREMMHELNPLVEVTSDDCVYEAGRFRRYNDLHEQLGYEWVKANTTARDFMVRLGGGSRRIIDPNLWINSATTRIDALQAAGKSIAVTDVRYLNEAMAVHSRGGVVWLVQRPGIVASNPEEENSLDSVASYGVDAVINNDGSVDHLRHRVNVLLGRWDVV